MSNAPINVDSHGIQGVSQELALSLERAKPAKFKLGHRTWLDVLRGLAVITVVAHHMRLVRNGTLGVDIFFVLSGFLITCILCEEFVRNQTISLKNFYIRRIFRLMPLLYVTITCYLVFTFFFFTPSEFKTSAREALLAATYTSNLQSIHNIFLRDLGYTWSLSVEEHFYFLWPLVLLAFFKFKASRKTILGALVAAVVAVAFWRSHLYNALDHNHPDIASHWYRIYQGTDARADALLIGCILGLIASWNLLPSSRRGIYALTAVGIASLSYALYCIFRMPVFHPKFMNGLYTGFSVMVALTMAWMLVNPPAFVNGKSWPIRALAGTGKISYALYLFHLPVMLIFSGIDGNGFDTHKSFGWDQPVNTVLALVVIVGLAIAAHFIIERPFLKMKKRFETASVEPKQTDIIRVPAMQTDSPDEVKRAA